VKRKLTEKEGIAKNKREGVKVMVAVVVLWGQKTA
jgi:hypothetical protein